MKKNRLKRTISVIGLLFVISLAQIGCGRDNSVADESVVSSVADYSNATVSYLGPEGTYTQEACGVFFEKDGNYISYETVADAVDAMESGDTLFSVIPQEKREDVFKPFLEIKDLTEGDGLGLPICKQMALKMNAELDIDPAFSKGTRFVLNLHV